MTVSVVIPAFNASKWIQAALQSVVTQVGHHLDVITVDDGSSDGTAEIVASDFPEVRVIRTPNRGASHARNVGTRAASGEFIQYLDADDLLAPGKLTAQLKALAETGADVVYGDWGKLVPGSRGEFKPGDTVVREMAREPEIDLFGDFWCPPAAYLFRRSIVETVGDWNENLPIIQDARFVLDCALHKARFVYCPGVAAWYRVHGDDSLSRRDPTAFTRDVYRNACEVEQWWFENGGISEERMQAVISCYAYVARASYEKDRGTFEQAYSALLRLTGRYIPKAPAHLSLASRILGYRRAESLSLTYRRTKRLLIRGLP